MSPPVLLDEPLQFVKLCRIDVAGLKEVTDGARRVAERLHLDVPRFGE